MPWIVVVFEKCVTKKTICCGNCRQTACRCDIRWSILDCILVDACMSFKSKTININYVASISAALTRCIKLFPKPDEEEANTEDSRTYRAYHACLTNDLVACERDDLLESISLQPNLDDEPCAG